MNMVHIRFCLVMVAQIYVVTAQADNPRYDYTPHLTGPVRVLPANVVKEFRGVKGLGLTKTAYKNGETWQALVCGNECSLQPVVLNVRSEILLKYFKDTVTGQRLSIAKPPAGELIVLFQGLPPTAAVKSPTTLLHRGMAKYPASGGRGSLEIGFPSFGSEKLRIVPRLTQDNRTVRVYLESDRQRQRLGELGIPEMNAGPSDIAKGRSLLLWAGDLDSDGKLDLVMSFESWVGNDSSVVLFLSSIAKSGDFVGIAGSYFLAGQYD